MRQREGIGAELAVDGAFVRTPGVAVPPRGRPLMPMGLLAAHGQCRHGMA